jgi:hypothetical protein
VQRTGDDAATPPTESVVYRFLAVTAIALFVVGCVSGGRVDGPVLVSPATSDDVGDALIVGVLQLDPESGCLLVVGVEGDGYPAVWPAGTSWRADPPGILLTDGQLVELGSSVGGGGGFYQRDFVERKAGSEVADLAESCAGPSGEIALFDLGGTVAPYP